MNKKIDAHYLTDKEYKRDYRESGVPCASDFAVAGPVTHW